MLNKALQARLDSLEARNASLEAENAKLASKLQFCQASLNNLKQCYVYMSSSVCYFYFTPATDKTQPIYHAVIPLRFLILIFLFDSTIVTKENLHLKKKFKTDNSEYVERE